MKTCLPLALTLLLPQTAWEREPVLLINAGVDVGTDMVAPPGGLPRTFSARAGDRFNALDYGALGTGQPKTVGSIYGANLGAVASFRTATGATPFAWVTNPAFGLTFSMTPSATSATSTQTFLAPLSNTFLGWATTGVAVWQDPVHGNYLIEPGMLVSGSCVASNTTVVKVNRIPGPGYGTINLSKPPASACSPAKPLTFTIAPNQLEALTLDWLGIQTAMAQAWLKKSGGRAYFPAGEYVVNHPLINAGGITDMNQQVPNLDVAGDGEAQTRIIVTSDLGTDACLFSSATRGSGYTSQSTYHDFRIIGPSSKRLNGVAPNEMDGICITTGDRVYGVSVGGMHAGLNTLNDHWSVRDVSLTNNGYGVFFAPYASTMGNEILSDVSASGNTIASVGITTTNQMDSSILRNLNTGFEPYGFYLEQQALNVSRSIGGFITGSEFDYVFGEALGNGFIYGANETGGIDKNTFMGGGYIDVGSQAAYRIESGSSDAFNAPAMIYADNFTSNTMVGTRWSNYKGNVKHAIIEVKGDASYNTWYNDTGFVFDETPSIPPIKWGNHAFNNRFYTSRGNGVFMQALYSSMPAGAPVSDAGNSTVLPYQNGQPFAGLTAAPVNGGLVGILTEADALPDVVKADPSQSIRQGQPVFAATGGVVGGLDPTTAIGAADLPSESGAATVMINLNPSYRGGAIGAATGLTASGTTQATAYVITSSMSQFTAVASGAGAILGLVPIGSSETLCNDSESAEKVYPQTGGTIQGLAQNAAATLLTGTCATYRRLTTTLWHQ